MDAIDEQRRAMLALRPGCTRALSWHGPFTVAGLLGAIPIDTEADLYGEGGVVAELEAEVATVLGKPAALFLPSGTMAQQSVLRVHADRRASRTVVFHPFCHLDQHEGRGYERLHGLVGRPIGSQVRLITAADLDQVAEPVAALVIELPQRDLGGRQPDWADLVQLTQRARERGAAVHLDGARLWESSAGYARPPSEIAALFDSVYVSFYKGLGGIAGCALAGEPDVVAEVKEWRQRHGGTLIALWPFAASALTGLRLRLPQMPRYLDHARAVAAELSTIPGVTVLPDPPQTPMMHLLLTAPADTLRANAHRLAAVDKVYTWSTFQPTPDPAVQSVELAVNDVTCESTPAEIRDLVAELLLAAP